MPDFNTARKFSENAKWNPPFNVDLQKALWTAQVLAFWLTDGGAYKRYADMEGLVTRNGHDPADPTKVIDLATGYALTDLRNLLNPKGNNDPRYVKGPDSLWGKEQEAESVIVEYLNTGGKFFGKELPAQFVKTRAIIDELVDAVSTPAVDAAKKNRADGKILASKTETKPTRCSDLDDAAYDARADCPKPRHGGGGGGVVSAQPPLPEKKNFASGSATEDTEEEEKDNTMLYVGIGLLGLALIGGVGYYMHQKNKAKSATDKAKALPAPTPKSED